MGLQMDPQICRQMDPQMDLQMGPQICLQMDPQMSSMVGYAFRLTPSTYCLC